MPKKDVEAIPYAITVTVQGAAEYKIIFHESMEAANMPDS